MYRRYCKEDIEDIEMNTKAETAEKGSEVINGSLQEAGGLLDGALLRSGSQRPREGSEVINGSLQEAGELVGRRIAEVWGPTAERRKRSD